MSMESIIFEGKTLADMFSDVYRNTNSKREQINEYVSKMVKLIRTPEDATIIGPIIKDFLEVNVKNDEHIVRLVQIAQRMVSVGGKSESDSMLSEHEKEQLLKNIKTEFETVISQQEEFDSKLSNLNR
jgi:hypothetical protein